MYFGLMLEQAILFILIILEYVPRTNQYSIKLCVLDGA